MLFRKIEAELVDYYRNPGNKVLLVEGARQIGKSFIIRESGKKNFEKYVEVNMAEDKENRKIFENVHSTEDFYFALSSIAGNLLGDKNDTLVFLDEIQEYPQLLTLLKFLKQENHYNYIASGSLLGLALSETTSIPIGSIERKRMYQLDFEEFLIANGFNPTAIAHMRKQFESKLSLEKNMHDRVMDLFRKYLIVGGMPDCVNAYLETRNVVRIRQIQSDIIRYYRSDASKRDIDRKLKIQRIYDMLPSTMQNMKKRVVVKDIEGVKGKRYSNYADEFNYLLNSGISNGVRAISNPVFPLCQSVEKNLIKLYMNDAGLLSCLLFQNNIKPIMEDVGSINLGALYETVVASELSAIGFEKLFYYDNRNNGEVDFLIDDYASLSILPLEIKSGRDYQIHSAINKFVRNKDYPVSRAIVFSNERKVFQKNVIWYLPIYYVMFLKPQIDQEAYLL